MHLFQTNVRPGTLVVRPEESATAISSHARSLAKLQLAALKPPDRAPKGSDPDGHHAHVAPSGGLSDVPPVGPEQVHRSGRFWARR